MNITFIRIGDCRPRMTTITLYPYGYLVNTRNGEFDRTEPDGFAIAAVR
ncbi:hypothetical protein BZL29_5947 [Mycobacterium kansasii]|uniref:Uncharacterized protein n=1 Tax=Mycobacterium kansasii TaxID=1768 RepID=A0A1V3WWI8_MYCKA|nr:hypothetical protein BZL29_5947 [Mycobacterium kansasii]